MERADDDDCITPLEEEARVAIPLVEVVGANAEMADAPNRTVATAAA